MERRLRKRRRTRGTFRVERNDPLFCIFEKHLYEFNYETRESFVNTVVREYILFVSKESALIPEARRTLLESTIAEDVSDMLVRKIYGCLQVVDSGRKSTASEKTRKVRERRSRQRRKITPEAADILVNHEQAPSPELTTEAVVAPISTEGQVRQANQEAAETDDWSLSELLKRLQRR